MLANGLAQVTARPSSAPPSFVILFILLMPSVTRAQTTVVKGDVRDSSGASVPGAQVELHTKSYSASTVTDSSGTFAFENVPEFIRNARDYRKRFQHGH